MKIVMIGTAGRSFKHLLNVRLWNSMARDAMSRVTLDDTLISGGAAWADHLAVCLYKRGLVKNLILHLPAPFEDGKFVGMKGTSGGVANYYHSLFSKLLKRDTRLDIVAAIEKGALVTYEPHAWGYDAMTTRNAKVAKEAERVIAYTFGKGDVPMDGGTKNTWDACKCSDKVHVSLYTFLGENKGVEWFSNSKKEENKNV